MPMIHADRRHGWNSYVNIETTNAVGAGKEDQPSPQDFVEALLKTSGSELLTQTLADDHDALQADRGEDALSGANAPGNNPDQTVEQTEAKLTANQLVCFDSNVLIATEWGDIPAGNLKVGDLVYTRDHGLMPIRWISSRTVSAAELAANPHLRPIRISAGALSDQVPSQDLLVSPQHRILIRSRIAHHMFGVDEVLAAATNLTAVDGIVVAEQVTEVTYVHFMFDDHQIVLANGAEAESLFCGTGVIASVGDAARRELFELFPDLRDGVGHAPARELLAGHTARKLAERHQSQGRPLVL